MSEIDENIDLKAEQELRLEAEDDQPSPTLASLLTAEEARHWLDHICEYRSEWFCPVLENPCCENDEIGTISEPPESAKLCHALWERAKEGK